MILVSHFWGLRLLIQLKDETKLPIEYDARLLCMEMYTSG